MNYRQFSMGFMDASGKMVALVCGNDVSAIPAPWCAVRHINADGSFNSAPLGNYAIYGNAMGYAARDIVIALNDDNTSISLSISTDDDTSTLVYSEARGSFLSAPARVFYGGMNSAGTKDMTITLVGVLQ